MPNFDRFINTDINTTPFQLVTFGKDAPLLEVELNEAQYIMYNKLQLIAKRIIGDIFDGTMTVSNSQLLIDGIFCVDGHIINCDNISVPISANKSYYMNISIKSVTGSTVIKKNGYINGDTIDNTIIDNRVGETTTGRKSIEFSISTNEDTSADSSVLIFSTSDSLGITKNIQDGKITTKFDSLMRDINTLNKETTVNLLKPTLGTVTQNGVTCTNNGDGTYTLNGTASEVTDFILYGSSNLVELNKEFRLTGCPNNTDAYLIVADWGNPWTVYGKDKGNGSNFKITTSSPYKRVSIVVPKGKTVDNIVFKPMITTNLNATYDDFVPYTGSTGQINSDVADIQSALDGKASSSHTHTKSQITDFPTSLPASDVYSWAKASTKPSYTKSEVGLGNVDNIADSEKSVKYATSAGSASNLSGFITDTTGFWDATNATPKAGKCINRMNTPNGGGMAFSEHDSTVDQIIDGKYYQDDGKYMCLDTNNYSSYAASKDHSHTTVNGHTVESNVPANAKFTDTDTWRPQPDWNATSGDAVIKNKPVSMPANGGDADHATRLVCAETRPTSADKASSSDRVGMMEMFIASSSMTTGKPSADAKILQMNWDNTSGWDSQLAMINSGMLQHRNMSNGKWQDWKILLDNYNWSNIINLQNYNHPEIKFNCYNPHFPAKIGVKNNNELFIVAPRANDNINSGEDASGLIFKNCASGIFPAQMSKNGDIKMANQGLKLGSSTHSFGDIYSNGVCLTSDKKQKKDIACLKDNYEVYKNIFDNIDFVKYRWKYNNNSGLADKPSSRYHYGVIAQDVEKAFKSYGLDNSDNGIIKAEFFLNNTSDRYICGGWSEPYYNENTEISYMYSKNVWNYKHNLEYSVKNEIIEKQISDINISDGYKDRNSIGYIMIEDNSKVKADNYHPPVKINSINLVDKYGDYTKVKFKQVDSVPYYSEDDNNMSTPLSSVNFIDNYSFEVNFDIMYGKHAIKVEIPFNIYDYEKIVADVDFIGEYKIYMLPEGNYRTTNFLYDIERVGDEIVYDYSLDYNELINMSLMVLQQKTNEFDLYKEQTTNDINSLIETTKRLEEQIKKLKGE